MQREVLQPMDMRNFAPQLLRSGSRDKAIREKEGVGVKFELRRGKSDEVLVAIGEGVEIPIQFLFKISGKY